MKKQKASLVIPGNIETTLGDLIAAVAEFALEAGKTEKEGYELASEALYDLLRRSDTDLSDTLTV